MALRLTIAGALVVLPGLLSAQIPPRQPPRDSAARLADSTKRAGALELPGDLPFQLDLRIENRSERDRNLRCNPLEAFQVSTISGCGAGFLWMQPNFQFSLKSAGSIGDQVHVNVDYDGQREFEASNALSLYYEGKPGAALRRIDVGNILFTPPPSRFLASSLPSGNYGMQASFQLGRLNFRPIFAKQTGNVVQSRRIRMGSRARELSDRDIDDYQIEPRRFFFTVDPALFGRAYPNIDILNRSQLSALRTVLPETMRPSRVLLYRLQFGTQPQNPSGPQFRLQGQTTRQTYDLLREGVDYYMDPSLLWFALVRPLNVNTERLVVAYSVTINGRETVFPSTGGTPDLAVTTAHDQVANLVMDPSVGPSSPAFRNEIRSAYRLAGPELVRQTTQLRIVTGNGLLEHPLAGTDATFLQMFRLAQPTNPSDFDYDNRVWPRVSDPILDLGAGAVDVRTGQPIDATHVIRDYFIVFPSLRPFAARDSGLVTPGNPANPAIYSTPGDYLYSPQHPASVYRLHVHYQTTATDESGVITLGASQMRQGSERVTIEGRPLVREVDYRIDYDLGRIDFLRPDTLFALERELDIRFEENPTAFAATPTSLGGFVAELPFTNGAFNFSAIQQSQSSSFTRPQLGFQEYATLTAGITGQFSWEAPALTRFASLLPSSDRKAASHFSIQGEVASSHPQFGARNQGQAYVEDFEGTNGLSIALGDPAWYASSLPAYGHTLRAGSFGPALFEPNRAATLIWQTYVQTLGGTQIRFTRSSIDPLTVLNGVGIEPNEAVLWLTLLPLDQRGRFNRAKRQYDWTAANQPTGRRWGSIKTTLNPAGLDLTGDEQLEFWTLVDTSTVARKKNPALIFDFGDISENSLRFGPETLTVRRNATGPVDSIFTGLKLQRFDTLDTERDPFSHIFNAAVNDSGLPGDIVSRLAVIDGSSVTQLSRVKICRGSVGSLDVLGDPHTNCTIGNSRLDEEDIDLDNALNFPNAQRESERLLRYVVDLSDPSKYKRVGGSHTDTLLVRGLPQVRTRRWVLVSIPFKAPTDSLNDVNRRRIRALRMTVVSGEAQDDAEATQFPIAQLRVTGAPWLNRSSVTLVGVAGTQPNGGFVVASSIGTTDSSATLIYQPPPGVGNAPDTKGAQFAGGLTQINERSMRIQAGNMPLYHRAETFFRFPAGPQNYFGYRQLHVWGRGHGNGWGQNGDLQMYVKVGRDENNFYLYRSPVSAGQTQAAWTALAVDFNRFIALRKRIETEYLAGKKESILCTGADSAVVVASPVPLGTVVHRFAACDDGYMAYTIDPAVYAPSLTAVQEIAVGFLRVRTGGSSPIFPSDTLDLWIDDIRLDAPANAAGYAGHMSFDVNAGDFFSLRLTASNKDPNFRQLAEQPTFLGARDIDITGSIRLDKLLPPGAGISLPMTITKLSSANDPLYLTQTDISARGISGVRKPRNDLTTYTLSARRSVPIESGMFAPLLNNLSATTSYTSAVDRTEYQDGTAHGFTGSLDYLMASDSARDVGLPRWIGATRFRWNPTQLRLSTGVVRTSDRRVSFVKPAGAPDDPPSVSSALSRVWRSGGLVELRPANGLTTHFEMQSTRDLRDYGDTTATAAVATRQRQSLLGTPAGFERDRTTITSVSFAPALSAWFHPRVELGTQYQMLRDPNARSLVTLPGVIGVDSVLAARDSLARIASFTLPRRMTAAQTLSGSASIDVAKFVTGSSSDETWRRIGGAFQPIDVSYTRSLLSALDAAPVAAPVLFQLGLGGQGSFRRVNGVDATAAGQTGTFNASAALALPLGVSLINQFRHTTTLNWIDRPDTTQAQADGVQKDFPNATLRWRYQPSVVTGLVTSLDASVGFRRSDVTVSLPSLATDAPPQIRHTHAESFPIGGSVVWGGGGSARGSLSTGARYALTRQIDSLPGSVLRSRGHELSFDASRAFRVPESWGLGLKNPVRARGNYSQAHNTTTAFDVSGSLQSRLRDNGREAINLAADTNVQENTVLTFQGSRIRTFDNNLNRRFEQLVITMALQMQFFAAGR